MKELKRRNYVINRRLQYGMISLFLGAVLLALFVTTIGFVSYYWTKYSAGENKFKERIIVYTYETGPITENSPGRVSESETTRMDIVIPPLLINNLCIMAVIALVGIFFSHRVAGPLYHIQHVIEEALEGKGTRYIQLRPRDFSQELASRVNSLLGKLEELKKNNL
jgi:hypothetical protein